MAGRLIPSPLVGEGGAQRRMRDEPDDLQVCFIVRYCFLKRVGCVVSQARALTAH